MFCIKKSRSHVDLSLEQTINADAAHKRTGINAMTNSLSARQRLAKSYFVCTGIISHVSDNLAMTRKEDVSRDLKPRRIIKNSSYLTNIMFDMCCSVLSVVCLFSSMCF